MKKIWVQMRASYKTYARKNQHGFGKIRCGERSLEVKYSFHNVRQWTMYYGESWEIHTNRTAASIIFKNLLIAIYCPGHKDVLGNIENFQSLYTFICIRKKVYKMPL